MFLSSVGNVSRIAHCSRNVRTRSAIQQTRRGLATHAHDFHIPVIDFGRYLKSASSKEKKDTADEIVSAFKSAGFVYLSNHGIPEPVVKNVFDQVRIKLTSEILCLTEPLYVRMQVSLRCPLR